MAARTPTISAQPKKGNVIVRPNRPQAKPSKSGPAARPRTTKVKGKSTTTERHIPAIAIKAIIGVVIVGSIFAGYKIFASSSVFTIRKVEVVGSLHASEDEITRAVRAATKNQSLLQADLNKVRHDVESKPIMKRAIVARVLPDTLRVSIEERQPVALARNQSGSFVWFSSDAVEIGDLDVFRPARMPPVLAGLNENDRSDYAMHDNRDRVALYQKVLSELGQDANAIDVIDLTTINPTNINFHLMDRGIVVHVGNLDYHSDLRAALNLIEAAKRGDRARLAELRVSDVEALIQNSSRLSFIYSLNGKLSFGFSGAPKSTSQSSQNASAKRVRSHG
jgi:cell division septal protein FtsQ